MHAPMPPPPMPRWPPLPTGAPPQHMRAVNTRSQPYFPPLPRTKPTMVHPVVGSRLWATGGQHTLIKPRAVLPYVSAPRAGVFQYPNPTYHQRAAQRQVWDRHSASGIELGRESEKRYVTAPSSEKVHVYRAPLPSRHVYTRAPVQQLSSSTPTKDLEASIWSTNSMELVAMKQQLAQAKRAKRKPQSQAAKAKKTLYYADECEQHPEEAASDDSTGDESSSDPEEDTLLSFRRFYALAYMLPPSPWSSESSSSDVDDVNEIWNFGGACATIEKTSPPAVQAPSAMDYRKLFALSVDTPSFFPQASLDAAQSTNPEEQDDNDPQLVRIVILTTLVAFNQI